MLVAGIAEERLSDLRLASSGGSIRVVLRILPPAASPVAGACAALDAPAVAALLTVQSLDPQSQLLSGCVHGRPHACMLPRRACAHASRALLAPAECGLICAAWCFSILTRHISAFCADPGGWEEADGEEEEEEEEEGEEGIPWIP